MLTRFFHSFFFIFATFLLVGMTAQAQWRTETVKRDRIKLDQNIILAASADLDQCRNGTELVPVGCGTTNEWVNGNANHTNAHWSETEFISYRMKFSGLTLGTHVVTVGYDIIKSGKHAIDYLGSYNFTEHLADPCAGVAGCTGTPDTFTVPIDIITVTNNFNPDTHLPIMQTPGMFTMWGGNITNVQYVNYAGGEERQITVTFTATVDNPVLSWGGHIAWMGDWGTGNSAVAVNGSPYHMRLIALDGSGGNQDRALDNTAVIPSGVVNIFKEVSTAPPDTSNAAFTTFNFTASTNFGTTAFGLIDDNAGPGIDVKQSMPITSFGPGNTITVTELASPSWTLLNVNCVENVTQDSTKNSASATATIIVQSGETVTCTYSNSQIGTTAAPATISGSVTDGHSGIPNAIVTATNPTSGAAFSARTNSFGSYEIVGLPTASVYIVQVRSKGYVFEPRMLSLLDNMANFDFTANPQ
jgi:hypothetical protein